MFHTIITTSCRKAFGNIGEEETHVKKQIGEEEMHGREQQCEGNKGRKHSKDRAVVSPCASCV